MQDEFVFEVHTPIHVSKHVPVTRCVCVWCGRVYSTCVWIHVRFNICVSVCIWCEFASPQASGGTKGSAKYKEQRHNLHNLAFDLGHQESPLAPTTAAKLFPSPVDSISELCLSEASASSGPHKGHRARAEQ